MGNRSSLLLRAEEIAQIQQETGFTPNQIERLYSRFTSLDRSDCGTLSREDFLRIPELAINPLGERISNAFFQEGCSDNVNFRQFMRVLAHFRPIKKNRDNKLNSREDKLKCVINHRFPNPEKDLNRFNIWLQTLNVAELFAMPSMSVYNNRRVCSVHFDSKYMSPGNPRLHQNAVPKSTLDYTTVDASIQHEHVSGDAASSQHDHGYIICESDSLSRSTPTRIEESLPSTSAAFTLDESIKSVSACGDKTGPKTGLLKSVSATKEKDLTPKAKSLYRSARYWKRTASRMKIGKSSFRERLAAAEKFAVSGNLSKMSVLTPAAETFIEMQNRETKNKSRARRFTKKEKILSLTLYKNSPKNYNLLHELFTLPSRKTLNVFLQRIQLNTGINRNLFKALKKNVLQLKAEHRMCVLMFDEVSIAAHFEYNSKIDVVEGFVDNGTERKAELADHALVFMVRGAIKQWKQPVAFTFCKGFTKSVELAVLIKSVVTELQSIGLKVVATVCDQARTNEAAINYLLKSTRGECLKNNKEWREECFSINGKSIVPLFDVPHIFKGIRNNMIKKNLKVTIEGRELTGKWEHIMQLYNLDKGNEIQELRLLPKLTEAHIMPNSRQKMKVKLCSQVFSRRVAAIMRHVAMEGSKQVEKEAEETAVLFLFLDKLFDSLNGSSLRGTDGKPLTAALSESSGHLTFWDEALDILRSMKFVCSATNEAEVPSSLKNCVKTIQGMKYLWQRMTRGNKVKFLFTRNFNQDPLENYFGLVRSCGYRNVNPTCTNFVQTFKTLTINNFSAKHSLGANCEEDVTDGVLSTLEELLQEPDEPLPTVLNRAAPAILSFAECGLTYKKSSYCAGFILKSVKKIVKGCNDCKNDLFAISVGIQHGLITAREYDDVTRLSYPTFSSTSCFIAIKRTTISLLQQHLEIENIVKYITNQINDTVCFDYISCDIHKSEVIQLIIKKTVMFMLNYYIKEKNEILKGTKKLTDDCKLDKYEKMCKNKYISGLKSPK